jgi:hypothetical protein
MSYIETSPIKNSTNMFLYSERADIKLDPPYQRMGGVWTLEKKQLLIDSIINDYDIPKIYFHIFDREQKRQHGYSYAVIDGRQRLETIWEFIDGEFSLSKDFEFQRYPEIKLAGLGYNDIAQSYPKVKIFFDSFVLPVIGVETDDEDLIEDMFSRLNEAVPLNAAEKRNALGGGFVKAIRELSDHDLFVSKVSFANKRFQHREVSARFLLVEHSLTTQNKIVDTKKVYLDGLAKSYGTGHDAQVNALLDSAVTIVDAMNSVFIKGDPLLRSQGNMVVYYLLFRTALSCSRLNKITRAGLLAFIQKLNDNRIAAAKDYENASFELLEYDRLTQQGTNDASNIRERFSVLANELGIPHDAI